MLEKFKPVLRWCAAYWESRHQLKIESRRSRRSQVVSDVRQEYRNEIESLKQENERLRGQVLILTEHRDLYIDLVERERSRVRAETADLIRREELAKLAMPQMEMTL